MSLQTRLEALVAAIGADIKQIKAQQAAGGGGTVTGTKVSALPAAAPLDGTELVHVVQGGISERTTVAALRPWNEQVLNTTYTNATLTGTDVFSGFVPDPNARYLVDVLLSGQTNATTTAIQLAVAGPTTGVTRAAIKIVTPVLATSDLISHVSALNSFQAATDTRTTAGLYMIQAIIEMGATPGTGNIRVQARSDVAIANAVQLFPGSSMRWRVI